MLRAKPPFWDVSVFLGMHQAINLCCGGELGVRLQECHPNDMWQI